LLQLTVLCGREGWEMDLFFASILDWYKLRIPAVFVAGLQYHSKLQDHPEITH